MAANPYARENRQQLFADILRNARGLPEAALTMGTSLADMAGTGLGTLAGMGMQKLRGEEPDFDAATETLQEGRFTYQPRSEGGQEVLRGLATVTEPLEQGAQWAGQKTADVTGSPAAGAAVYTGLNMLDPEMLAPAAAKVAALRGASNVARSAAENAVPMNEALRNVPQGQRGAYTLEDLAAVEGDFGFRSPTLEAFGKLKPQEQGRVTGKQLAKALMREGAKKEELEWMGLTDIANSDALVNVADVRQIAEANQPEITFASTRAGSGEGTIDDDAINERARELVYEDDDLEYPIQIYQDTGGGREYVETVDNYDDAKRRIRDLRESYVDDNLDSETDYYLEQIDDHFDEEQLAEMSDEQRQAWAEEAARSSLEETARGIEYETENDYDAEPGNFDDLMEYWERRVREAPEDYGLEGTLAGEAPAYGQYTVGGLGNKRTDANYTVSAGRLEAEERFGRGGREAPPFIAPYLRDEVVDPNDPQQSLFKTVEGQDVLTPYSQAFAIEALRRRARDSDPNVSKYRAPVSKSHYDELGDNQIFFTRETDRPAPEWGSVQQGIGRVPGSVLRTPGGGELPQGGSLDNPTRLVDEAQSDWLQAGRKTGWADPKGLEKIAKEDADLVAGQDAEKQRVESFQQQALSELPTALEDERISNFIETTRADAAAAVARGEETPYWADRMEQFLARFVETNQRNPAAYSMDDRLEAANNLFTTIYNASDSGSPAEAFSNEIRQGLSRLPTMTQLPRGKDPTPSSPMRETRQYSQLAMADALRRAVQEGQQYLAWTPGDVHTKRWGTDTVQYAAVPENPRLIRYSTYDTSKDRSDDRTGMENLQATAEELLDNANATTLDLDSPDIDRQLYDLVRSRVDYGMHEHRRPEVARQKRAALIKKEMEAVSKAAQAGERKAGHYSPRALGYDLAYEPTAEDIISVLRRSGVQGLPQIRDLPNPDSPRPLRGFEIDPEVAQAAKRGLMLPY